MRLLLCTDLDRTLLPNGPQAESPAARRHFAALVAQTGLELVYVTGRSLDLTEAAIEEYALPYPNILLADVGTRISKRHQGQWELDQHWDSLLAEDFDAQGMAALFSTVAELQPQEEARQSPLKRSYYVDRSAVQQSLLARLSALLKAEQIEASLIWSHDERADQNLLDILPRRADKYLALEFLRQQQGYEYEEMLFAGDSGNDLSVLTSPIPAVLVGNAQEAVVLAAKEGAAAAGQAHRLYHAQGGFLGMNGCYSAGILEGLAWYYPALVPVIRSFLEHEGGPEGGD
jgi:sucrose-6F-phosphate phosphohydrolase